MKKEKKKSRCCNTEIIRTSEEFHFYCSACGKDVSTEEVEQLTHTHIYKCECGEIKEDD